MKKEEPRAGKRMPIKDSDGEDESKKNDTTQINPDLSSTSQPAAQENQGAQAVAQTQEKEKVIRANNT